MAITDSTHDEYYEDEPSTCHVEPLQEPEETQQAEDGADEPTVDIADFSSRACNQLRSVCSTRSVEGIPPSRLIAAESRVTQGTGLADGGADTIVCGVGWTQQSTTARTATIKGFSDDLTKTEIPIGTAISAVTTSTGSTILLQANEALLLPTNQYTILSALQLREHGVRVHDVARRHGGDQCIQVDSYTLPLEMNNGLLTVPLRVPTEEELLMCPVVPISSEDPWDPSNLPSMEGSTCRINALLGEVPEPTSLKKIIQDVRLAYTLQHKGFTEKNPKLLRPYLGWIPESRVKNTLENTTQLAELDTRLPLRRHLKSRYPQLKNNRPRLAETYCTDTMYASKKSIEGYTCAQLFVGKSSKYTKVYGMHQEAQGIDALQDFIRDVGAPYNIHSDNSKMQTSNAWKDVLRHYNISQTTTEPYHPQQNYAERRIQDVKALTKQMLDRAGVPGKLWYLALAYASILLNKVSDETLGNKTPTEAALGIKPDISDLLQFKFYEQVYYHVPGASYPTSGEELGNFVGIADDVGDELTFLVLTKEGKVIPRSVMRSAEACEDPNKRVLESDATTNQKQGAAAHTADDGGLVLETLGDVTLASEMPAFDPNQIAGYKFVREVKGEPRRSTVLGTTSTGDLHVQYNNGEDAVVPYAEFINYLNKDDQDGEQLWGFEKILRHKVTKQGKELQILWDTGEITWEPLPLIRKSDPVSVMEYVYEHNLQDKLGWRWAKKFNRGINKYVNAVLRANNTTKKRPTYKFGIRVPDNVAHALQLDKENGNTYWRDAINKELAEIDQYDTFHIAPNGDLPEGYKRIPYMIVFDVKFDLRRKARLVAGGHRTDPPPEDVYSGVVMIDSVRLALFLGVLNNLNTCAADVGCAFLHGRTKEKYCIRAGPEFGDRQGKYLIIYGSLYGLRSSAARWHEYLSETLVKMGFKPSKADPDLRIKDCGTHYEYVAIYVDDLIFVSKDPMKYIEQLKFEYEMKGVGVPEYYLGGNVDIGTDGTMYWSAKTYIKNVVDRIEKLFEVTLKTYGSPLEENHHPEIDESPLLGEDMVRKYQMLIGCANWIVILGRFDVMFATVTMARFSQVPREGHLKAMLRVFGYLKGYARGRIEVDTSVPRIQGEVIKHNWGELYPDAIEELPHDMPTPKGKPVLITGYVDADHAHDLVTRRSVTGVLLFLNSTPIKWYSKRQNTVETSTYGSEMVAARIATELIMEMRYKLRMLGIPILGSAALYGDNQGVVLNTTVPSSTLKKKHNSLAYHRVREAIAAGVLHFFHIKSTENVSDVLTKPMGPKIFYGHIKKVLFGARAT